MKNLLFICMGNICRSPSAEAIMKNFVFHETLLNKIFIDSAGTMGYHTGQEADASMKKYASTRGYNFTCTARQFNLSDSEKFDYIAVMVS